MGSIIKKGGLVVLSIAIFYSQIEFANLRYGNLLVNPDCPWCEMHKGAADDFFFLKFSPQTIRFFFPSDPEFLTDVIWLQAIYYYGQQVLSGQKNEKLFYFFDLLTENSPKWSLPYFYGALLLALETDDPESAYYFLEKGIEYHPQMWELWFLKGYIERFIWADYGESAKSIQAAALIKGSPPYLAAWAVSLSAEAGGTARAKETIFYMLQSIEDPVIRQILNEKLEQQG